jgi:site-specific DNA-methyltransferase (adenine-specific)
VPKAKTSRKPKPLYKSPPPRRFADEFAQATPLAPAHFELRDDGTIATAAPDSQLPTGDWQSPPAPAQPVQGSMFKVQGSTVPPSSAPPSPPRLAYHAPNRGLWLYHGNCLELLDAIYRKYGEAGRFDAIFADPPYFLSNGGITCHAGRMVKVDKGDWDKSRGPALNHEFNTEWLRRCQRVLKPNGTLWVTGTHHVIFSVGYALQQLGFKILNDIAWEKPNPPPNLSCRYFTHSTETVIWAAKNEKSKHTFNYPLMRRMNGGKQMKTVWSILPPSNGEKALGKHPTQKPLALVERCLLASTNEGDLVLDPFLGGGTTAVACLRLRRLFVGLDLNADYLDLAAKRADHEIVQLWLHEFCVRMAISVFLQNDLDPLLQTINGSAVMNDKPEVQAERIFHECKFVFLSCAQVAQGSVVHTTVDVSLQEAWSRTPRSAKRETTHVVRCETEIFRIRESETQR